MAKNNIIGRAHEIKLLDDLVASNKAEFVALYGRRRVGKTYLLQQYFDGKLDFYYTGMFQTEKNVQLDRFATLLSQCSGAPKKKLKTWFDAFDALRQHIASLTKKTVVVFLDELPWMDTPKSNFLAAFSEFWNSWGCQRPELKLFICGSSTTWIMSNIIGDRGGLYGRMTRAIYIAPFNLSETEQFLVKMKGIRWNRHQILELYMILGGIPYYLDQLKKGTPFTQCIDSLFFAKGAVLRNEFDFLYRSLYGNATFYKQVIDTLSKRLTGLTRTEIAKALKVKSGGALTEALENLCNCDFIRRYTSIGKSTKDTIYQLTDLFSLFHLRFVKSSSNNDENFWTRLHGQSAQTSWAGYAFEQVCLHHIPQIKAKLGISGVLGNVCSWIGTQKDSDGNTIQSGQIDLLIDRNDDVINVCEIKYYKSKFNIDDQYAEHLRERTALFQRITKTNKALWLTFITTYGLAESANSGEVQNVVVADDLFAT